MKSMLRAPLFSLLALSASPLFAQGQHDESAGTWGNPLLWLAIVTMVIAIGAGVWQLQRVRKAKRTHAHSSLVNVAPPTSSDRAR